MYHQFRNTGILSNGSGYLFKKTIVIHSKGSPELTVPKQSPTFRTARRNPLKKKHKTLFVQKKSSAVQASASRSKKLFSRLLSYQAEVCFQVQQNLRLIFKTRSLALR